MKRQAYRFLDSNEADRASAIVALGYYWPDLLSCALKQFRELHRDREEVLMLFDEQLYEFEEQFKRSQKQGSNHKATTWRRRVDRLKQYIDGCKLMTARCKEFIRKKVFVERRVVHMSAQLAIAIERLR